MAQFSIFKLATLFDSTRGRQERRMYMGMMCMHDPPAPNPVRLVEPLRPSKAAAYTASTTYVYIRTTYQVPGIQQQASTPVDRINTLYMYAPPPYSTLCLLALVIRASRRGNPIQYRAPTPVFQVCVLHGNRF